MTWNSREPLSSAHAVAWVDLYSTPFPWMVTSKRRNMLLADLSDDSFKHMSPCRSDVRRAKCGWREHCGEVKLERNASVGRSILDRGLRRRLERDRLCCVNHKCLFNDTLDCSEAPNEGPESLLLVINVRIHSLPERSRTARFTLRLGFSSRTAGCDWHRQ